MIRQILVKLLNTIGVLCVTIVVVAEQPGHVVEVCPNMGIQARPPVFEPAGIILTTWDGRDLWAYDIRRNVRYPLADTAPCGAHCHLSPDQQRITYYDVAEGGIYQMRLDGSARQPLVADASEVEWWSEERLLVWTPVQGAYLLTLATGDVEPLMADGLVNVQPGGYHGVQITFDGETFWRRLVDLRQAGRGVTLSEDLPTSNAMRWSPDGEWLAYVRADEDGANLYGIRPADTEPVRWTDFDSVRINGSAPGELSWSPDGDHIAFWVIPAGDHSAARIHILDVQTREVRVYCGYETEAHTPNPPRLIWSPDGSHLAFGGPRPEGGTAVFALNTTNGVVTLLSADVHLTLGKSSVTAWGRLE